MDQTISDSYSVVNYSLGEDDVLQCVKCQENGEVRFFSKSDRQTLKDHLAHDHDALLLPPGSGDIELECLNEDSCDWKEENLEVGLCRPKRRKKMSNLSRVWKYYCQPMRGKDLIDPFLYCIMCFNAGAITRYRQSNSTTTLRNHLRDKHRLTEVTEAGVKMETDDLEEKLEQIRNLEESDRRASSQHEGRRRSRFESNVWDYFGTNEEDAKSSICLLCAANDEERAYKRSSSTTTLKNHLLKAHNLDPDKESRPVADLRSIPEHLKSLATERISDPSHKVWHYYVPLQEQHEDLFYCVFCLCENIQRGFRSTTSTTNLKSHLDRKHGFQLPAAPPASYLYEETDSNVLGDQEEDEHDLEPQSYEIQVIEVENEEVEDETEDAEYLEEEPRPVPEHCRACGKADVSFFTKITSETPFLWDEPLAGSLAEAFFECTGVQVEPGDGKSQLLCYVCEASLKTSFRFRRMAQEIDGRP